MNSEDRDRANKRRLELIDKQYSVFSPEEMKRDISVWRDEFARRKEAALSTEERVELEKLTETVFGPSADEDSTAPKGH